MSGPIPTERFYGKRPTTPPRKSGTLPIPSTPISLKTSGSDTYDSGKHLRNSLNKRLAKETKGHFLGGMPVMNFINHFFPDVERNVQDMEFGTILSDTVTLEVHMYQPFITEASRFVPSLEFCDTHSTGDINCDDLVTDVTAYRSTDLPSNPKQTNFAKMELLVEFKLDSKADPFVDTSSPNSKSNFERDTDAARLLRGQLSSYVAAISGSQFRVHVFTILICGHLARLMYWDRNGAVVSEAFEYAGSNYLGIFLKSFDENVHLRGHDPSVTTPGRKAISGYDLTKLIENNERHSDFRVMLIPDCDDASKTSQFLISFPPKYNNRSPFGRATRPMLAYDVQESRIVFIKDYWRSVGYEKEGDIYKTLVEKKVPYIATFEKGNDIAGNITITDRLRKKKWASPTTDMVPLHNYRMSLKEVGRPLNSFQSSHEFVSSVADAMEAHDTAYFEAGILHRDISLGNILISDEGRGLLIDWDLCLNTRNQDRIARRPDRTGTWQFMSAKLLYEPHSSHGLEDDRESAFYVLLYLGLLYTQHNQTLKLKTYMDIFDYVTFYDDDNARGGNLKRSFLATTAEAEALKFQCSPMNKLIKDLRAAFSVRYIAAPSEQALKDYETLSGALEGNPLLPEILQSQPVTQYKMRMNDLLERGWFSKTIRKYLEDPEIWPANNKVNNHLKRKREETERSGVSSKKASHSSLRHLK